MSFATNDLVLVELTDRVSDPCVAAVWSLAGSGEDPERRGRVLALYPPAGTRRMFGFVHDGATVATCGISEHADGVFTIHQMATVERHRRCGIGRRLLEAIFEKLD